MITIKYTKKILIIILILTLCLYGCNDDTTEKLSEKVIQQIKYLDIELLHMLNDLNKISYENYEVTTNLVESSNQSSDPNKQGETEENSEGDSSKDSGTSQGDSKKGSLTISQMKTNSILSTDRDNIEWEVIKSNIEELYLSWTTITADLYKLNVSGENILAFSTQLDLCVGDIKTENKQASLENLGKLYSVLYNIYNNLDMPEGDKNIQETKMNIINAYTLVNLEEWERISEQLKLAEESLNTVLNDLEYLKDKEYKVNKIYIILKELQRCIELEDKDVFYIKYKNIMEQLKTW